MSFILLVLSYNTFTNTYIYKIKKSYIPGPMSHDGVVDSNGKIRGLESIRICDASVFPTVPRAR